MVFPKRKEVRAIYKEILNDGTIVVQKEWSGSHETLKIENLKVWKIMKSLTSQGMATEVYNWGYYYYAITEKGVTFVKEYLGYTDERLKPQTFIVKTENKSATNARAEQSGRSFRGTGTRGGRGRTDGEAPQTEIIAPAKDE